MISNTGGFSTGSGRFCPRKHQAPVARTDTGGGQHAVAGQRPAGRQRRRRRHGGPRASLVAGAQPRTEPVRRQHRDGGDGGCAEPADRRARARPLLRCPDETSLSGTLQEDDPFECVLRGPPNTLRLTQEHGPEVTRLGVRRGRGQKPSPRTQCVSTRRFSPSYIENEALTCERLSHGAWQS